MLQHRQLLATLHSNIRPKRRNTCFFPPVPSTSLLHIDDPVVAPRWRISARAICRSTSDNVGTPNDSGQTDERVFLFVCEIEKRWEGWEGGWGGEEEGKKRFASADTHGRTENVHFGLLMEELLETLALLGCPSSRMTLTALQSTQKQRQRLHLRQRSCRRLKTHLYTKTPGWCVLKWMKCVTGTRLSVGLSLSDSGELFFAKEGSPCVETRRALIVCLLHKEPEQNKMRLNPIFWWIRRTWTVAVRNQQNRKLHRVSCCCWVFFLFFYIAVFSFFFF